MPIGLVADAGQNGGCNSGPVPRIGNAGRGSRRLGDIRHIGDIGNLSKPTGMYATGPQPGSIAQDVARGPFEGPTQPPGANFTKNFDGQQEDTNFYSSAVLFCGKDAGGEGFDPYSSKCGMRTG